MLSRRFKAKFDATSIDEFVGEFKRTMPGYPCPSTPTVYRYIDQGLLDISNIDLPMKLKRRKNQPALMTLTERTTRFEVVIKIPDYRASTCQRLLQKEIDR
ncbi:IS30 family transposase, partial [Lactobacillus crispatus]